MQRMAVLLRLVALKAAIPRPIRRWSTEVNRVPVFRVAGGSARWLGATFHQQGKVARIR
jgi:hypothetical protein